MCRRNPNIFRRERKFVLPTQKSKNPCRFEALSRCAQRSFRAPFFAGWRLCIALGYALLAHSLTFLTIGGFTLPISGGFTLRKFGGAKLLITRRWPLAVRRAWLVASCGLLFIKTRLFAASSTALLKFWTRKCGKYFVGI